MEGRREVEEIARDDALIDGRLGGGWREGFQGKGGLIITESRGQPDVEVDEWLAARGGGAHTTQEAHHASRAARTAATAMWASFEAPSAVDTTWLGRRESCGFKTSRLALDLAQSTHRSRTA